jgi:hypothetical protein
MTLTHQTEHWLQEAGYEYQCFISWPRTQNPDITGCARMLKQNIQEWLALSFSKPMVFLDETDVVGGDDWETKMRNALCRSIVLVAVCAPIYYHPSHKWCGIEWATMQELSRKRLPAVDFHAIIPLIIRGTENIPEPVKKIQYHDMSGLIASGKRYFKTRRYREIMDKIIMRIEEIAVTLSEKNVNADCENFEFASESAFSNFQARQQPMPFRKENPL